MPSLYALYLASLKMLIHPISPFLIAAFAILAAFRPEITKVLKHQDRSFMRLRKLNDTSAYEMGYLLIPMPDLVPEVYVILFARGDHASFASVACNAS